jgi:FkbM family methyltransferase
MIFFVDIPKTAGTSCFNAFRSLAGDAAVSWFGPNNRPSDLFSDPAVRDKVKVYGGHYDVNRIVPFLRPGDEILSIIREPVERVLSYYNHVGERDLKHSLRNLVRGKGIEAASKEASQESRQFLNEISDAQCWYLSGHRDFRHALERIQALNIKVYQLDQVDQMLESVARSLGTKAAIAAPQSNVAAPGYAETVSASDREFAWSINTNDIMLHKYFELQRYECRETGNALPQTVQRSYTKRDVANAFHVMLGRAPESDEVIDHFMNNHENISGVYSSLLKSDGFFFRSTYPGLLHSITPADVALLRRYVNPARKPVQGYIVDFVGARTDVRFGARWGVKSGLVEDIPRPSNFHSMTYEWAGAIRSIDEVGGRFVMMELGAGYGPWLASCGVVAREKGVGVIKLIGVEADEGRFGFMQRNLKDNGLNTEAALLLHGVIAPQTGGALFRVSERPDVTYGATPIFFDSVESARAYAEAHAKEQRYNVIRAYSLSEAMDGEPRLDLLHIDIQGSEADLLEANTELLDEKVRRVVVGTHGRSIEERLHSLFAQLGWKSEADDPCRFNVAGTPVQLAVDGTQVWSNPKLDRT